MSLATRRLLLQGATTSALVAGLPIRVLAQGSRPNLTIAVQDLRTVLEPMHPQSAAAVSYRVQPNVFDALLTLDYLGSFATIPALAVKTRQIDDRTHEFSLRSGVKFHDGSEMTADDVIFTFGPERLLGDKAPGRAMKDQFLPTLQEAVKIDDQTVRLKTSAPDPVFLKRLATWGGQIISRAAYLKAANFDAWARAPVGTGPFRVGDTQDKGFIHLIAHDEYWGGKPTIASLKFVLVPELAARVSGLLAGDYDIITDVTPDQISTVEARPGYKVVGGEAAVFRNVNFDTKTNAQLADVNLRRAMSLAVDRQLLAETLWRGKVTVPNGEQFSYFGGLYDASRKAPLFDPKKARELLMKSTYKGEEIPYRTVGNYYTNELETAQALIEMWKAVGINVKLELRENWDQVYQKPGTGLNNDSCAMFYPDPLSTLWRCYGDGSSYQTEEKSWANPEFNRLGHVLQSSVDEAERQKAFRRMLEIFEQEDPPGIMLHTMAYLYGIRSSVNWRPYPVAAMDFRPQNITIGAL